MEESDKLIHVRSFHQGLAPADPSVSTKAPAVVTSVIQGPGLAFSLQPSVCLSYQQSELLLHAMALQGGN